MNKKNKKKNKKNKKNKNEVVVQIWNGMVSLEKCPKEIMVIIKDYDIEGIDISDIKKDKYGDKYQEIIFNE